MEHVVEAQNLSDPSLSSDRLAEIEARVKRAFKLDEWCYFCDDYDHDPGCSMLMLRDLLSALRAERSAREADLGVLKLAHGWREEGERLRSAPPLTVLSVVLGIQLQTCAVMLESELLLERAKALGEEPK